MFFNNKKAEGGAEMTLKDILIALAILLIVIFLIGYAVKKYMASTYPDCEPAWCKSSCDLANDIKEPQNRCSDSKVCCRPMDPATNPVSIQCSGKKIGDYCAGKFSSGKDIPMVCDKKYDCVDLCNYCAENPADAKCSFAATAVFGKKVTQFNSNFKCGCTQAKCNEIKGDKNTASTCIQNFCSSTTPGAPDYMCCNI